MASTSVNVLNFFFDESKTRTDVYFVNMSDDNRLERIQSLIKREVKKFQVTILIQWIRI